MEPITESEAEIVQNDFDMSVSQYSNKMAIFEKIDWNTFSLHTSQICLTLFVCTSCIFVFCVCVCVCVCVCACVCV